MENASKALIIASSVLISLLIIGALVFMFNSLRDLKTVEASSEEEQKLAEYNKRIETFNRRLYGSELVSLANLIDDYNIRQANLKGYKPIELTVDMKDKVISETLKLKTTLYTDYQKIREDFGKLESKVNETKNAKKLVGGTTYLTAEKIAGMRTRDLGETIRKADSSLSEEEIDAKVQELLEFSQDYTDLKSEITSFKNSAFEMTFIDYDINGRVKEMKFELIR
ncbi:MAG: hypothetical protein HFJ28_00235 [Clostridia bacterium]|jgi:hypothetical protein|nr:hypothetical protein [Clostridia bacterium]